MKCEDVREIITLFVEGELDDDTSKIVQAHIDSCEKCRSLEFDAKEILHSLRSAKPIPVPERMIEKILKRTSRKRGFSALPIFQPQLIFAFSIFVMSFLFFTSPKKALFVDSFKFKAHRTYSQVVKYVSKIDGVFDYVKSSKLDIQIKKEKTKSKIIKRENRKDSGNVRVISLNKNKSKLFLM